MDAWKAKYGARQVNVVVAVCCIWYFLLMVCIWYLSFVISMPTKGRVAVHHKASMLAVFLWTQTALVIILYASGFCFAHQRTHAAYGFKDKAFHRPLMIGCFKLGTWNPVTLSNLLDMVFQALFVGCVLGAMLAYAWLYSLILSTGWAFVLVSLLNKFQFEAAQMGFLEEMRVKYGFDSGAAADASEAADATAPAAVDDAV